MRQQACVALQIGKSLLLSLKEDRQAFLQEMLFQRALWLYRKNKLSLFLKFPFRAGGAGLSHFPGGASFD
jgi:hypothetical protein